MHIYTQETGEEDPQGTRKRAKRIKNLTFSEIVGDDRNLPEPEKESSHYGKPTTHLFSRALL